jgi:hypothetical protein
MKNFSKNNKIHTHNIETSEKKKKGKNKFDIHEGRNINPTVFQPWEPSRRGERYERVVNPLSVTSYTHLGCVCVLDSM